MALRYLYLAVDSSFFDSYLLPLPVHWLCALAVATFGLLVALKTAVGVGLIMYSVDRARCGKMSRVVASSKKRI